MRNGGKIQSDNEEKPAPLMLGGVMATTLSQGHHIELLTDKRPSNETRAFCKDLINSLAFSVGLDYALLYAPQELGSAGVRFLIAKAKDWSEQRQQARRIWCNRVYKHIIAGEIAAGRLEPCPDNATAYDVKFVSKTHWSIDL